MKVHGELELAGYERVSSNPATNLFTGRTVFNTTDNLAYIYYGATWNVIASDGASVALENLTINGYIIEPLSIGDPGLEAGGVNVNGVTYNAAVKINDIGGTEPAQFVLHKHSTTLPALMLGTRSNSNTDTHASVTNGMNLFEILSGGWTGTHYDLFGGIYFNADSAGTVSSTSSPGTIDFLVTPDGGNIPQSAMTIRQDKTVEFKSATADTVPYFDANKKLTSSSITTTELTYLSGVTSSIQTQINVLNGLNVLTTDGDMTYYNTGAYQRLAIGTANQVLTVSGSGLPAWMNAPSGFADPMSSIGDIIIRDGTNTTNRLGIGTANQVLTSVGGLPVWQDVYQDPLTTRGDIAYRDLTSTTRLPLGAINTVPQSDGTDLVYGLLTNSNIDASAAIAHSKMAALTASRVLVSDGSGFTSASTITATTLAFLDATSSIQTQIDSKFASADVIDEDNMISDLDTKVPTQQSVKAYVDTGLATKQNSSNAVTTDGAQTITALKTFDTEINLKEIATPSTPATGYKKIYPKADGFMYTLNDAGVEQKVGSGAGTGSFNYIANPDAEVNATDDVTSTATTGSWSIARTTTAAELPEPTAKSSAYKISGSTLTVNDYVELQSIGTINDADGGYIGRGEVKVKDISGTISGEYKLQAYDKTNSVYIGQSQTVVSDGTYVFDIPLTAETNIAIHLIALTASPSNIGLSGVGIFFEAASTNTLQYYGDSYTPTPAGGGSATYTNNNAHWWRDGEWLTILGRVRIGTGGSGTSTFSLTIPTGLTINSSKLPGSLFNFDNQIGDATFVVGGSTGEAVSQILPITTTTFGFIDVGGATVIQGNDLTASTIIGYKLKVPILEWANSDTLTATEAQYQNARASAYRNTSVQALTGAAYNNTAWNALESTLTTQGITINTSTGNFTPAVDMWVDIHFSLSLSASVTWSVALRQSTTVIREVASSVSENRIKGSISYKLTGGTEYNLAVNPSSGVNLNNSQTLSWIDIKRDADRSSKTIGFPTSDKADTTKQYLIKDVRKFSKAADGSFTSGTVYGYRDGDLVTIIAANLGHASSATVASSVGFIPDGFRPAGSTAFNCYLYDETHGLNIQIATSGDLTTFYRNEAGTVSRTSTLQAFVTYRTEDA